MHSFLSFDFGYAAGGVNYDHRFYDTWGQCSKTFTAVCYKF
jgi:hypothetical protein